MSDIERRFTPGPWTKKDWAILDKENQTVISKVLPWDASGCRQEDIANANLISAAPELFETLLMLHRMVCNNDNYYAAGDSRQYQQVHAVLDKALGEE